MDKQPNILFIMTDQQRADAMGCSGGWVETPHLDRLAAEGVRFTNCVTTTPVCIPARRSMATGHYPHNTGVWDNCHGCTMPADQPTWMQALQKAGYRTSLFGKTHLHPHEGDLREREDLMHAYGLDDVDEIGGPRASARVMSHMTARWQELGLLQAYRDDYDERFSNVPWVVRPSALPLAEYADTYVGQHAADYLRSYERTQPWFCWVSFGGPHEPWDTPEPFASRYDPAAMPAAIDRSTLDHQRPPSRLDERLARQDVSDPEQVARMRADYAGNISLIDEQIGRLIEVIEARGEWDNTIVAFTSDHGEMNGDYGLIYKSAWFSGAVRVPMIVRTPATAVRGGATCTSPTEWFDVGPTLVEAAGGAIDFPQFARSMQPCLDDPAVKHRDFAISEQAGEIMILDERWKMAITEQGDPYLLYDQQEDPNEEQNLVNDPAHADLRAGLRDQIFRHLLSTQLQQGRRPTT